jgi:hypothetical protein
MLLFCLRSSVTNALNKAAARSGALTRNNHDCAAFNSPNSCAASSWYDFSVNFITELKNRGTQYSICKNQFKLNLWSKLSEISKKF